MKIKSKARLTTSLLISVAMLSRCLIANAGHIVITGGLPIFPIADTITIPANTPELSLDFEVNVTKLGSTNSSSGAPYRTGNSELNEVNQQTNLERLKEQDSDEFKKAINRAELHPHFRYPLYNIKNESNKTATGKPRRMSGSYEQPITMNDVSIMDTWAKEHFNSDMTNYDKIEYTWLWLWENLWYATGQDYMTYIAPYSNVEGPFVHKVGQCLQYNGALCSLMCYMGYDVYLIEMYTSGQHFRMEVDIDGIAWGIEVGNKGNTGNWHYLGDKAKANIPDHNTLPDDLYSWRKFTENKYKTLWDNDDMPPKDS